MISFKTFFTALFCFGLPLFSAACDITCTVEGAQKTKYQSGDIVIIKITVDRVHRNCQVDIDETKITVSGMEIEAATKWVNTTGRIWERKVKVRITSNKKDNAVITAKRSCKKDGGSGTLALAVTPVK